MEDVKQEEYHIDISNDPNPKPKSKLARPIIHDVLPPEYPPKKKTSKVKPVVGLLSAPYLVVRPFVRRAAVVGEKLYDNIYAKK